MTAGDAARAHPRSFPWPEDEERARARIRGVVESVVQRHELEQLRIEWVTPRAHPPEVPSTGQPALRVTVSATGEESYEREVWGPQWNSTWGHSLQQLAGELEDWVCETRFAWGQRRHAMVPD